MNIKKLKFENVEIIPTMMVKRRRKMKKLLLLAVALSLVLAACAQPTPVVVEKEVPVEIEVIKEVVVEKEVPVEVEKELITSILASRSSTEATTKGRLSLVWAWRTETTIPVTVTVSPAMSLLTSPQETVPGEDGSRARKSRGWEK